jgi:hypothetical protein
MKAFPLPVLAAAAATAIALPFSAQAAGFLALTTALCAIVSADYSHRYRGLRLPRQTTAASRAPRAIFRAPPLCCEPNRLAA